MKGKRGRPAIPLSGISNRKASGLSGSTSADTDAIPVASARGGAAKKRLDRKARGGATKKWIAGSIKHPGAMTAAAKREGISNSKYEQEHKNDKGKSGKRARLAITLAKMHKK